MPEDAIAHAHDTQKRASVEIERNENTSSNLFANPEDFLKTLRTVMLEHGNDSSASMNAADFRHVARTESDPRQRAAAKIASEHYDRISDFDHTMGERNDPSESIDIVDINKDIRLVTHSAQADLAKDKQEYLNEVIAMGALAGFSGLLAIAGGPTPVAGVFGPSALMFGGAAMYSEHLRRHAEEAYERKTAADISEMKSWGIVR